MKTLISFLKKKVHSKTTFPLCKKCVESIKKNSHNRRHPTNITEEVIYKKSCHEEVGTAVNSKMEQKLHYVKSGQRPNDHSQYKKGKKQTSSPSRGNNQLQPTLQIITFCDY